MTDPRALAEIFAKAEARLVNEAHPDPYIRALIRNIYSSLLAEAHSTFNSTHDAGRNQVVSDTYVDSLLLLTYTSFMLPGSEISR